MSCNNILGIQFLKFQESGLDGQLGQATLLQFRNFLNWQRIFVNEGVPSDSDSETAQNCCDAIVRAVRALANGDVISVSGSSSSVAGKESQSTVAL